MISGPSSVGNPCNLSEGGISDFLIENLGSSLWLWFALGGATAEVVRAVRGASTAEVLCCQGVGGQCFYSRGVTCCQGVWLRVVRGRGTAAVRATRLLLYRRSKSRGVLHAFKNNVEVLLRLWYSSHLIDLLVGRPTHRLPAARQHHLQDPRRRLGAVEHALLEERGGLDADGVVARKSAWRGKDVLC